MDFVLFKKCHRVLKLVLHYALISGFTVEIDCLGTLQILMQWVWGSLYSRLLVGVILILYDQPLTALVQLILEEMSPRARG